MKRTLGRLESLFLAYAQLRKLRTVRRGDLSGSILGLTPDQERKLLSRMARANLIARVRRGLYLVPPQLPLGGVWTPDPILALTTLVNDRGGRYQICGPSAFSRYGFDNQVPNRLYAYNTRISGPRRIGAVQLELIKVSDHRLGDAVTQPVGDGLVAVWSSRVRTLVDAVYDWSRFDGLPRAYRWIAADLKARRVRASDLVACTLKYGDRGTQRRLGALLENLEVAPRLLKKLERRLPRTTSPIPWIPTQPKRGPVNRRWGVVLNGEA